MFDHILYQSGIQRLLLCLICDKQIDGRNDAVCAIQLKFGSGLFAVGIVAHHAEMLPIKEIAGLGMADGEVGIAEYIPQQERTFVTEWNPVGRQ